MSKVKSIGELRVRTDFNVSQSTVVDDIKTAGASFINLCESLRSQDPEKVTPSEKARLISLAQTSAEEAAMWAVKAATY